MWSSRSFRAVIALSTDFVLAAEPASSRPIQVVSALIGEDLVLVSSSDSVWNIQLAAQDAVALRLEVADDVPNVRVTLRTPDGVELNESVALPPSGVLLAFISRIFNEESTQALTDSTSVSELRDALCAGADAEQFRAFSSPATDLESMIPVTPMFRFAARGDAAMVSNLLRWGCMNVLSGRKRGTLSESPIETALTNRHEDVVHILTPSLRGALRGRELCSMWTDGDVQRLLEQNYVTCALIIHSSFSGNILELIAGPLDRESNTGASSHDFLAREPSSRSSHATAMFSGDRFTEFRYGKFRAWSDQNASDLIATVLDCLLNHGLEDAACNFLMCIEARFVRNANEMTSLLLMDPALSRSSAIDYSEETQSKHIERFQTGRPHALAGVLRSAFRLELSKATDELLRRKVCVLDSREESFHVTDIARSDGSNYASCSSSMSSTSWLMIRSEQTVCDPALHREIDASASQGRDTRAFLGSNNIETDVIVAAPLSPLGAVGKDKLFMVRRQCSDLRPILLSHVAPGRLLAPELYREVIETALRQPLDSLPRCSETRWPAEVAHILRVAAALDLLDGRDAADALGLRPRLWNALRET